MGKVTTKNGNPNNTTKETNMPENKTEEKPKQKRPRKANFYITIADKPAEDNIIHFDSKKSLDSWIVLNKCKPHKIPGYITLGDGREATINYGQNKKLTLMQNYSI